MKNSEKFTSAKERAEACMEYYRENPNPDKPYITCAMEWLDLEAPAEEPLPCPFCEGKVNVKNTPYVSAYNGNQCQLPRWNCVCSCGMESIICSSRDEAISAYNRVARAAM